MALRVTGDILIEPDDQYASSVVSLNLDLEPSLPGAKVSISTLSNQTLSAAFNKVRDDTAGLLTGGLKVRSIRVITEIS